MVDRIGKITITHLKTRLSDQKCASTDCVFQSENRAASDAARWNNTYQTEMEPSCAMQHFRDIMTDKSNKHNNWYKYWNGIFDVNKQNNWYWVLFSMPRKNFSTRTTLWCPLKLATCLVLLPTINLEDIVMRQSLYLWPFRRHLELPQSLCCDVAFPHHQFVHLIFFHDCAQCTWSSIADWIPTDVQFTDLRTTWARMWFT